MNTQQKIQTQRVPCSVSSSSSPHVDPVCPARDPLGPGSSCNIYSATEPVESKPLSLELTGTRFTREPSLETWFLMLIVEKFNVYTVSSRCRDFWVSKTLHSLHDNVASKQFEYTNVCLDRGWGRVIPKHWKVWTLQTAPFYPPWLLYIYSCKCRKLLTVAIVQTIPVVKGS